VGKATGFAPAFICHLKGIKLKIFSNMAIKKSDGRMSAGFVLTGYMSN
jgi:hypothetical protein